METGLVILGFGVAAGTLCAILWSVAFPDRRIWPPKRYTASTPVIVWTSTLTLFGVLIALGVLGWEELSIPTWLRFGIGVPLIVLGNVAVWSEVTKFGISQTGGAPGTLRTRGLYRFSRNPQYLADIGILAGWAILAAASWVFVVASAAVIALLAAPFAEEPWLRERYGTAFETYAARVPRFV